MLGRTPHYKHRNAAIKLGHVLARDLKHGLQKGDALLLSQHGTAWQRLLAPRVQWQHCAMYVGDGLLIEALPKHGVRCVSYWDTVMEASAVAQLRPRGKYEDVLLAAAKLALNQAGKSYDTLFQAGEHGSTVYQASEVVWLCWAVACKIAMPFDMPGQPNYARITPDLVYSLAGDRIRILREIYACNSNAPSTATPKASALAYLDPLVKRLH